MRPRRPHDQSPKRATEAAEEHNEIVETIEARCMAVDGPVTPTGKEMTEDEGRRLWDAAQRIRAALSAPPREVLTNATPSSRGSVGNVVAALASFFIPGLGQLVQGRLLAGILHFVLAAVLWLFLLGWIVHLGSAYGAATWTAANSPI